MSDQTRKGRPFKALFVWSLDKVVDNLPTLLALFAGSGVMTYLASISDQLRPFGAVVWGVIGLGTLLLLSLIYLAYAAARQRIVSANIYAMRATATRANVLAPVHEHERLLLADFYHPITFTVSKVRFSHCEMFGPMLIRLESTMSNDCKFLDCEVVIVKEGRVKNLLVLEHCQFVDTTFHGVTFLVTRQEWDQEFSPDAKRGMTMISDSGPEGP